MTTTIINILLLLGYIFGLNYGLMTIWDYIFQKWCRETPMSDSSKIFYFVFMTIFGFLCKFYWVIHKYPFEFGINFFTPIIQIIIGFIAWIVPNKHNTNAGLLIWYYLGVVFGSSIITGIINDLWRTKINDDFVYYSGVGIVWIWFWWNEANKRKILNKNNSNHMEGEDYD